MKLNKLNHSVYHLQYHVVWVCKYRKKVLRPDVEAYLRKLLPTLLADYPGASLETIGFDRDHLHMVLTIPPKYSISQVMNAMKSRSTSRLRKEFAFLGVEYYKENVVWSPGYFVSSVGVDEDVVKRYVKYQGRRDSGREQLDL